jgi:ferrous iron transport protein B
MKRVALLGMPNSGKSTFFNRLTGATARVANWPGMTVDLLSAKLILGSQIVEIVDLPGIYDLSGFSEDEEVVRSFLSQTPVDLIIVIINSVQIQRQLRLVLQLKKLNKPLLLVLNMADEAKKLGITIDMPRFRESVGLSSSLLSAKYGHGFAEINQFLQKYFAQPRIELALPIASSALSPSHSSEDEQQLENQLNTILETSVQIPIQASHQLTERLDRFILHPLWGIPLFLMTLFFLFQAIFTIGKPIQDGLAWGFQAFRTTALEPLFNTSFYTLPSPLQGLLLDGIYNGLGTVASFVPIIVLFFLFMALVEDSGYLSRAAFLMDACMSRLGLDGRSFVMILMGFGCNVPALMGTRVMRSKPLRLLSLLVIPFSLCSARLQVFLFFTAALFTPTQAPIVLFSLYLVSLLSIFCTAYLFQRVYPNDEPFVLEIPPYRLPTFKQLILRGWNEVRHFLHRATHFIIIGVVGVWILTHFPLHAAPASAETWAGQLGHALAPLLKPIGINQSLAIALLFGFMAKEIVIGSLAVIYGTQGAALSSLLAHQMTWIQAYSFMLFTLIYTPCLSTVATLYNESKGKWFTLYSILWSLFLAWISCFAFYQIAIRI